MRDNERIDLGVTLADDEASFQKDVGVLGDLVRPIQIQTSKSRRRLFSSYEPEQPKWARKPNSNGGTASPANFPAVGK